METTQLLVSIFSGIIVFLIVFKFYFMKAAKCRSTLRLDGKNVIVTGANSGIGKETARELAKRGACVIMACRDVGRAERAAADIHQSVPNANLVIRILDLASMKSIKDFAEDIINSFDKLDILINNAAVFGIPRQLTEDGFETTFAVNYLGHFLLTNLLRELLIDSAPSRVINVSAHGHLFTTLDLDDLMMEKNYGSIRAYCTSKLAQVMFTQELAHRWEDTGVTAYSLHPGVIHTSIHHNLSIVRVPVLGWLFNALISVFMKSAREGAQTTLHCALSESVLPNNGRYFSACALSTPSKLALVPASCRRLWELSAGLVGLAEGAPDTPVDDHHDDNDHDDDDSLRGI